MLAMEDRKTSDPTGNRRGCFIIAALIALALAALAYLGFSGDPIDHQNSTIPTVGGDEQGDSQPRR